jgi:SAM-dependent methyltransferase
MTQKGIRNALRPYLGPLVERLKGLRDSLSFNPEQLGRQHFTRYAYYRKLEQWVSEGLIPNTEVTKAIEFGASNGVIPAILNKANYTVAPNWPEVDIQNLYQYQNDSFDVVVIDQILEHVADPKKAVSEIGRVLRKGGTCVCATPFLIRIHGSYGDYWRFAELGLKQLFSEYSEVEVFGWGNRLTIATTMYSGWLSCQATRRRLRARLHNEPEWPLVYLTRAAK